MEAIKFLFVDYLWQLPQNIVGLIVKAFTKAKWDKDQEIFRWKKGSGLSLGLFAFVSTNASEFVIKHEKGHQKQSLYLGWLYLLIIGLPSLIWCILWSLFWRNKCSYYSFYTEKWANKIAGIEA